jgi:hypothetical protein
LDGTEERIEARRSSFVGAVGGRRERRRRML